MRQEPAQSLARDALVWLAQQDDLLEVFMGATGCGADDIRSGVDAPEFLASVLDFLLLEDRWVVAFSGQAGIAPEAVPAARQALPGGAQVHWT